MQTVFRLEFEHNGSGIYRDEMDGLSEEEHDKRSALKNFTNVNKYCDSTGEDMHPSPWDDESLNFGGFDASDIRFGFANPTQLLNWWDCDDLRHVFKVAPTALTLTRIASPKISVGKQQAIFEREESEVLNRCRMGCLKLK
ncbi:MAG: hypothetical protein KAR20_20345 [Candidatus Heimdallarchaeota archaeon]|nr:hypothetical protein [Candidatus Heimdallarchaeota archaeon]